MVHRYYLIMSIEICCNTCCQCITIVSIILMNLILNNIYGFLYIRREFYWILVIYRLYGNYPNGEWYMPSGHLYHKLYTYGSKIFLVLMTRRGNNFGHCWYDALIVCSILPLSFFLRIWNIRNEIRLIFLLYYLYNHSRTICCV